MAFNFLLAREIKEDQISPGYFFYGEEAFLADEFVRQLKDILMSPESQGFNLERFSLGDSRWADIIDLARTVPFFFSPWRMIIVEAPEEDKDRLSSYEEKILRDYFISPTTRTVVVVIVSGKVKKAHPLVKFFSSFPASIILVKELKPLKGRDLSSWMDRKLETVSKRITPEAKRRLEEIIGNDLRRIDNELDKIVNFAAERKVIDLDDINQVCEWAKAFVQWELTGSLEKANYKQALLILNQSFREGVKPEYILGIMASFFRDILLAKIGIRENRDRREIFAELRPQIQEKFRDLYAAKFKELFLIVEGFSQEDLNFALRELEGIDLAIKTTDASAQVLLEAFVFDYCQRKKLKKAGQGPTWAAKR